MLNAINALIIFILATLITGNNIAIIREPLKYSGIMRGGLIDTVLIVSIILGYVIEGPKLFIILSYIPVSDRYYTLVLSVLILFLVVFNLLKIPYSLTQGIVGGLLGVAFYNLAKFNERYILILVSIWIIYPLLNIILSKYVYKKITLVSVNMLLTRLLGIITVFFIGYTFGSNTIGALMSFMGYSYIINYSIVITSTALGVLFIGKRTGEILAGKLYGLRPRMFLSTTLSTATLIEIATQMSIPIPLSSLNTLGYIGPALAVKSRIIKYNEVMKIILFWMINPILALVTVSSILYLTNFLFR